MVLKNDCIKSMNTNNEYAIKACFHKDAECGRGVVKPPHYAVYINELDNNPE